jgi:UDP-N-acetylglucosamine 4,6-dehydratase/5-epimerase
MRTLNYFITGGTGSFAKEFIVNLIKKKMANKIIVFSRDEFKQLKLKDDKIISQNLDKIRFFLGDVRDYSRLNVALRNNIDVLIHAAALKQVPATEYNPFETVKTNVLGAQNVVEAALNNNVKKVLALSTDKACAPINLYGATKLTSDKLFINAHLIKGKNKTIFSVVRYGNVLGSRGSVVPIFLKQKKQKFFTVTDKKMTRFNISLPEAADFVINCLKNMKGQEIFVPKIPSYKILDVVKAINPKPNIKIIGIRPGEKIHEEMISKNDSYSTLEFKKYYIIYPTYKKIKSNLKDGFSYSSDKNTKFLSPIEIRDEIKKYSHTFEV